MSTGPSGDSSFLTTRWSVVARATSPDAPAARAALEDLCRAYWWPLYAYLRRRGTDGERAADLVQGLFAELIEKGRLAQADENRGRFRGWMLKALQFHASHERDRGHAAKRGGGAHALSLDVEQADRRWQLASSGERDPEATFEHAWALATLEAGLARLRRRMEREGKTQLLDALLPFLTAEPDAAGLSAVATSLGSSEGAVKVAAHRLRQAWREEIRAEIASTLDDVRDLDEEVRALFRALAT